MTAFDLMVYFMVEIEDNNSSSDLKTLIYFFKDFLTLIQNQNHHESDKTRAGLGRSQASCVYGEKISQYSYKSKYSSNSIPKAYRAHALPFS